MTTITISHIDTCLSCYLQDHHNRDGEWLIGIAVDNTTTYADIREQLLDELQTGDAPEGALDWSATTIDAALDVLFAHDHPADLFDSELPPACGGEMPQVWLLVKWSDDE